MWVTGKSARGSYSKVYNNAGGANYRKCVRESRLILPINVRDKIGICAWSSLGKPKERPALIVLTRGVGVVLYAEVSVRLRRKLRMTGRPRAVEAAVFLIFLG